LLVDPGTCNYVGPRADREEFRSTRFHNTATVDNRSQAEPRSPFSWFRWPVVHVEIQAFGPGFQFIRASHDGYERLRPPVTHCRTLFAPSEGFWFILDQFLATGPHSYNLYWHLAPGTAAEQKIGDNQEIVIHRDEGELHLLTDSNEWHSAIESGWFSPAYGVKQSAPVVCFAKRGQGDETIATVLWAGTMESAIPVLTKLSQSGDTLVYQLTTGNKCSILVFGNGKSDIRAEGWESDARFLYGTLDTNKSPSRVVLVQASYVRYRGQTLYDSPEKQAHLDWRR